LTTRQGRGILHEWSSFVKGEAASRKETSMKTILALITTALLPFGLLAWASIAYQLLGGP
jgi:hypothetical protein